MISKAVRNHKKRSVEKNKCKICGSSSLDIYAHTAKCNSCKVLLYYPYPKDGRKLISDGNDKSRPRDRALSWYSRSSFYNHINFTNIVLFAMGESYKDKKRKLDILDYGGGGGQFALVCKSHFLQAAIYITDIRDELLLEEWSCLNNQIPFREFAKDNRKFDFIFLNDVFEHISAPSSVLKQLAGKLKNDGKIFIDTPKQFWIYPTIRMFSKLLYLKILKGTVSTAHLQIWSKKSFELVVHESGLQIIKYDEISEYTMPPNFYMENMGIRNPLIKLAGNIFYRNAKWLAKNKIICVLSQSKA